MILEFGRINPYKFVNCMIELGESYKGYMTSDNKILSTVDNKIYALKSNEVTITNG